MHKVFGVKCDASYIDRNGAYLIPFHNGKLGVVQTSKGFFFLAAASMKIIRKLTLSVFKESA